MIYETRIIFVFWNAVLSHDVIELGEIAVIDIQIFLPM
jgi:hypothetical protein